MAYAAAANEDGDFIRPKASAWCQGHGLPWMCEGDYQPGRGLLGEVHLAEEGLEAGNGSRQLKTSRTCPAVGSVRIGTSG